MEKFFRGSENGDSLFGSIWEDVIDGRGGNDWIHSGSGNDFAFGGGR
ncbi:hypothetical protein QA644_34400 (plasmid) [Rhizobium sp. CC1099]|nr:hypothetical protein [Rhizobium sp. CC1099]WFU91995.1 hypothetical protein QA644_34400 [Rhizobium sp. CC1099]